jgi:hypothetical protein
VSAQLDAGYRQQKKLGFWEKGSEAGKNADAKAKFCEGLASKIRH